MPKGFCNNIFLIDHFSREIMDPCGAPPWPPLPGANVNAAKPQNAEFARRRETSAARPRAPQGFRNIYNGTEYVYIIICLYICAILPEDGCSHGFVATSKFT